MIHHYSEMALTSNMMLSRVLCTRKYRIKGQPNHLSSQRAACLLVFKASSSFLAGVSSGIPSTHSMPEVPCLGHATVKISCLIGSTFAHANIATERASLTVPWVPFPGCRL